jgi:hypothetical protein
MSTLEVKAIQAPTGYDLQMPAGHILQTVTQTYSTPTSINSTSFTSTGLTKSITPTSTSSKILVIVNLAAETFQQGNAANKFYLQLLRDSTQIVYRRHDSYAGVATNGYYSFSINGNIAYLDSPSTTSSVTYALNTKCDATTNSFTVRCQDANSHSTITLMEVAG